MKFAPRRELGRHLGGNVIRELVDQTRPAGQSDRMTDKQHNVVQAAKKAAERTADLAGPKIPAASDSDKAKADHRIEGRTGEARRPLFFTIEPADCRKFLPTIEANSIHLTVTDPPYFLDGLDNGWRNGRDEAPRATGSIGSLPVGMKFDPRQGRALQAFISQVGEGMKKAMKPGAFAVVFSQPRLAHRMAVGLEDVGFEIRDLYAWRFTRYAQSKAFTLNHFVDRMDRPKLERETIKNHMGGRKTPQLRPQFEAMILAQKPREGTFIANWTKHETGLIDTTERLNGKAPATVMTVEKPFREGFNSHLTVKPLELVEHLIRIFSLPGQVVLDPFLGSGTTVLAAKRTGRSCIGIEINDEYVEIAKRRLGESA